MSDRVRVQAGDGGNLSVDSEATMRAPRLSRRRFLTATAGIGTALAVPALPAIADSGAAGGDMGMDMGPAGADMPDSTEVRPFTEGVPLTEPEVRRSVDGELRTTLKVQYAYQEIGGFQLYMRNYEGTIPGPTLRLRPGDKLKI